MDCYNLRQKIDERKKHVLSVVKGLSNEGDLSKTGALVRETRDVLKNGGYKISMSSVREMFEELEAESSIYCVDPSVERGRRYLAVVDC